MAEIIAALLLLSGAAISLIAAIGVARLPDAFLRMHAATKAGVVGAGLTLLGVGFAFDTGEAWFRVTLIVAFLLVTVPISSHALGRAAYIGGAPMWSGTVMDDLKGVLPRHAIDTDTAAQQAIAMPVGASGASTAPRPDPVAAAAPRRMLLALADGPGAAAALRAALEVAAGPRTEITLLSLLCTPSLNQTGPMPVGGAHFARRLVEARFATAREAAASLATQMETHCQTQGYHFRMRHEEGDASALLAHAATHHDLTVLPRGTWFDQAQALDAGYAAQRSARVALPGLLLTAPDFSMPGALHFLHEGDLASSEALKRFLGLGFLVHLPLTITGLDLDGAEVALDEAVALAAARERPVHRGPALLHPDRPVPLPAFTGGALAIIPERSSSGREAWRSLREMEASVLLA